MPRTQPRLCARQVRPWRTRLRFSLRTSAAAALAALLCASADSSPTLPARGLHNLAETLEHVRHRGRSDAAA